MRPYHHWKYSELKFIQDNATLTDREIGVMLNKTKMQVKQFRKRHKIKKCSTFDKSKYGLTVINKAA